MKIVFCWVLYYCIVLCLCIFVQISEGDIVTGDLRSVAQSIDQLAASKVQSFYLNNYIPRRKSGVYWIQVHCAAAVEISQITQKTDQYFFFKL